MNVYALYRTHNHHFAIYGAMFLGQYAPAMEAAQELIDTTPEALLRIPSPPMADFVEGYLPMKQHVLVRFGKWREIIAQELPEDRELYCSTTAMMLYAKGGGPFGRWARSPRPRRRAAAFLEAKARVPETRLRAQQHRRRPARRRRGDAERRARIPPRQLRRRLRPSAPLGRARRRAALRRAVGLDAADRAMRWARCCWSRASVAEAEAVYRSDLGFDGKLSRACQHPDNVWSLHGLHECLTRRGDTRRGAADQGQARPGAGARRSADPRLLPLPARSRITLLPPPTEGRVPASRGGGVWH